MENPCEKCLVKAICMHPCENLNNFANSVGLRDSIECNYNNWIEFYECRPRVLHLYSKLSNGGVGELV